MCTCLVLRIEWLEGKFSLSSLESKLKWHNCKGEIRAQIQNYATFIMYKTKNPAIYVHCGKLMQFGTLLAFNLTTLWVLLIDSHGNCAGLIFSMYINYLAEMGHCITAKWGISANYSSILAWRESQKVSFEHLFMKTKGALNKWDWRTFHSEKAAINW